jgi:hypothetical protein
MYIMLDTCLYQNYRSLVLCVCFVDPLFLFLLAIVLSVLLRFMDSDYPFGIFKTLLNPVKTTQQVLSDINVLLNRVS